MVRISDILRQGKFPEPDDRPKGKKEKEQPSEERPQEGSEKTGEKSTEGIQFSKAMSQEEPGAEKEKETEVAKAMRQMQLDSEESRKIYNQALEVIKKILNKKNPESATIEDLREAYEIVKVIIDRTVLGDKELISLAVNSTDNNYLYAHSVNVCILSTDLGLALGYNKSKLNELGLGALLHDWSMMKVIDITKQPRTLTESEFAEVKKHPIYNSDVLSRIKNIQEGIIYIAKEHHERFDGSGYPGGLKDDEMNKYSQIVALVDVYEALTHCRPHRKATEPNEAIKELLAMNASGLFDKEIIKLFLNRIGLYPVGSWVELNTDEIGKVILSNEDFPLRPKVNIIFGPKKEKLASMKFIDLSQSTNLYIKRAIKPSELNLKLE